MPRSYDQRKEPGGPEMQKGAKALRGPKRTGPIGSITPGDHVEVAREIQRLWLAIRSADRNANSGGNGEGEEVPDTTKVKISHASASSTTLVAGVAGQIIKIHSLHIMCATDQTVTFEDSDGTDLSGAMSYPSRGGVNRGYHPDGIYECGDGKGFKMLLGVAGQVSGDLSYSLTPV